MLQAKRNARIARFGAFELDRQTAELRKHGVRIRLQTKPYQILLALLDRPGETISREELQQRLWPADTFVDFDSGLNTAANRLRIALGDSAENPRYIETLARSGYRFIAPVEEIYPDEDRPAPAAQLATASVGIEPRRTSRAKFWLIAAAGCAAVVSAGSYLADRHTLVTEPSLHQITFRRGTVFSARFAPDGQTVLYTAKWSNSPQQIYVANSVSPESRALGRERTMLTAVSRSSELALISNDHTKPPESWVLSRVPLNGGGPLEVAKHVTAADWSVDGRNLAIIRKTDSEDVVEYPVNHPIYRSFGNLSHIRLSPKGDYLAFFEHPFRGDDGGDLRIIDTHGKLVSTSAGWASASGVAWCPSGKEVMFTASRAGAGRSLYAVTTGGRLRVVAKIPGTLTIHDISPTGRVLVSRDNCNLSMAGMGADDDGEKDMSWFDWSCVREISRDGKFVLFDESGEGAGPHYSTFLRRMETGETIRLGDGRALALSPDNQSVITMALRDMTTLNVVPVGAGQPRAVTADPGFRYQSVRYFPDGENLLIAGGAANEPLKLYTQPVAGGKPKALPLNIYPMSAILSPDGKLIAGKTQEGKITVSAADGTGTHAIPNTTTLWPVGWTTDPDWIYAECDLGVPAYIFKVNIHTGKTELWKEVAPADQEGVMKISKLAVSPDGKSYVYSYHRTLSELFIVDGWAN